MSLKEARKNFFDIGAKSTGALPYTRAATNEESKN